MPKLTTKSKETNMKDPLITNMKIDRSKPEKDENYLLTRNAANKMEEFGLGGLNN